MEVRHDCSSEVRTNRTKIDTVHANLTSRLATCETHERQVNVTREGDLFAKISEWLSAVHPGPRPKPWGRQVARLCDITFLENVNRWSNETKMKCDKIDIKNKLPSLMAIPNYWITSEQSIKSEFPIHVRAEYQMFSNFISRIEFEERKEKDLKY